MIDLNRLQKQLENAKNLAQEVEKENRIFDDVLRQAIKGAEGDDVLAIEQVRSLSQRAINLAKQGKGDEAQELIKNFKNSYGSKSNK